MWFPSPVAHITGSPFQDPDELSERPSSHLVHWSSTQRALDGRPLCGSFQGPPSEGTFALRKPFLSMCCQHSFFSVSKLPSTCRSLPQAAVMIHHRLGGSNNGVISHSSGGSESQIKVLACSGSGESPLPGLWKGAFSPCPRVIGGEREREL